MLLNKTWFGATVFFFFVFACETDAALRALPMAVWTKRESLNLAVRTHGAVLRVPSWARALQRAPWTRHRELRKPSMGPTANAVGQESLNCFRDMMAQES